ncbi:MAG TPA: hypothetical protein VIH75_03575 [Candidatus Sulfotelmatobacter sp.]|jgi:hypothetical protein
MLRLPKIRLLVLLLALPAILMPPCLVAQKNPNDDANQAPNQVPNYEDPNDTPLGDVARSLRKKSSSSQDVIDDDNLTRVMEQAESHPAAGSALKFLMAGESKEFHVAAPDVTCSLSFNANAKSLLSNGYAQMELPPGELLKLEGPATIEGDALIVSVYNRTDWHVSEVAVALTVVKKIEAAWSGGAAFNSGATLAPAVVANVPPESEVRPEKKPDVTVIYRMRAAAPPSAITVFSAPLNLDLASDEEWHWAIVQARGYPPQSYAGNPSQKAPQTNGPESAQSVPGPPLSIPQNPR